MLACVSGSSVFLGSDFDIQSPDVCKAFFLFHFQYLLVWKHVKSILLKLSMGP